MTTPETGTMFASLRILFNKGVRYSTIIDVGCADGHFCLNLIAMGLAPGAVPLNVDANTTYEESLRAIKEVLGGHYRICAVTDRHGEVELTTSVHPYWASLRPAGDPYWQRLNDLSAERMVVPATTLDALSKELSLQPPFLLKLDVQGAESGVLRGAVGLLKDTQAVICEADVDDFQEINAVLAENGFVLYDATHLHRLGDGTLGWFYPVYINRRLDFARPKAFWDARHNEDATRAQVVRRDAIRKSIAEMLARIRNAQALIRPVAGAASVSRNQDCPCGSGRRFKHCCGART